MIMQAILLKYFLSPHWVCDIMMRPWGAVLRIKQGDILSASLKFNSERRNGKQACTARRLNMESSQTQIDNVNILSFSTLTFFFLKNQVLGSGPAERKKRSLLGGQKKRRLWILRTGCNWSPHDITASECYWLPDTWALLAYCSLPGHNSQPSPCAYLLWTSVIYFSTCDFSSFRTGSVL